MNSKLVNLIQKDFIKNQMPDIKTWMEIEIHQKIKEWNKERIQKFKWLVIKTKWKTPLEKTVTVRRVADWFWIEKIIPINSPTIVKIDIVRLFKVRRANIGYIRELKWKAARLKEIKVKN